MLESTVAPLAGKRILVTRTREQASVLSERLHALGAIPIEFPTIRIVPPADWTQLDAALRDLYRPTGAGYSWLILTSVNGVQSCFERLRVLGYDPSALCSVRIATIGPATAAAVARYGLAADLVPDEYRAESVLQALIEDAQQHQTTLVGQRVLLARAAEARNVLVDGLQQAGVQVDEVAAYYTLPVERNDEQGHLILRLLQERQLAMLTFTSSSTVRNFVAWLRNCEQDTSVSLLDLVKQHAQLASIGPITSQTARELGLRVDIEAREFTIDGLVEAIIQHKILSR